MSDRVVGNTLDRVIVTTDKQMKRNKRRSNTHCRGRTDTKVMSESDTYVYFKIPSNLDVQMIMLLSADPEANLLPAEERSS